MIAPRLILEVGYGATWQTEPGDIVWVDETARVNDRRQLVEIVRGASSARGVVDTGELKLTLNNQDRRFDPTYADGPLYGLLVPGVPIRVLAQVAGVLLPIYDDDEPIHEDDVPVVAEWETAVPVWSGTVASWPQRYDRGNTWATVPLQCFDRFDKLSRAKIPRSVIASEIQADSPHAFWPLDEQSGRQMSDLSSNGFSGVADHGTTALAARVESADGASIRGIDFDAEHRVVVADVASVIDSAPVVVEALIQPKLDEYPSAAGVFFRSGTGNPNGGLSMQVSSVGFFAAGVRATTNGIASGDAPELLDGNVHHVAYRLPAAGAASVWVDGVNVTDSTGTIADGVVATPGTLIAGIKTYFDAKFGGFISNVAVFSAELEDARIEAHAQAALSPLKGQRTDERIDWILDEIGWPAGLRDFERGRTILGPATFEPGDQALAYLRLLEATEDGRLFIAADGSLVFRDRYWPWLAPEATISQVTFTDQPGGACYADFQLDLDDDLIVNVARFSRRGGVEQVATDPASIAVHGEAEEQRSDLLVATDAQARSLAEWTVATKSVPLPRVPHIRVPLHTYSPEDQGKVLTLDLEHRVSVKRTPQGIGDPIELDFLVRGIRHEVGHAQWWTTLYVEPVPTDAVNLFLLDISELDGPDILAY